MKPAKEYSILPQCERDNGYVIRPERTDPVKNKSCLVIAFVILAVIVIISGALALVIGLFYSEQFTNAVNTYWVADNLNKTNTINDSLANSSNPLSSGNVVISLPATTTTSSKNPTLQNDTVTIPAAAGESGTESTSQTNKNGTSTSIAEEVDHYIGSGLRPGYSAEVEDGNATLHKNSSEEEEDDHESGHIKKKGGLKHHHNMTMEDREEEFAETMHEVEKYMENITGIRRPEFVIPLMMIFIFVVSLSLAWCCCYIFLKNKERRRRRDISKIITDLQAGEKGNLMDQEDDE